MGWQFAATSVEVLVGMYGRSRDAIVYWRRLAPPRARLAIPEEVLAALAISWRGWPGFCPAAVC